MIVNRVVCLGSICVMSWKKSRVVVVLKVIEMRIFVIWYGILRVMIVCKIRGNLGRNV